MPQRRPVCASSPRQAIFCQVDKSRRRKRSFARLLAVYFERHGANEAIIEEAVANADARPSKRTAEMMMWAAAVAGKSEYPQYFPATTHIRTDAAKEASANGLARDLVAYPDGNPELRRYLYLSTRG